MSSTDSDRAKERKQSRTVKALADKLQAGWTMLAQICPQCNTPLVREKGGQRIYCVSCELWVVRESDINKQEQSNGTSERLESSGRGRAAAEKSIEELESGLASLSAHNQFGRIRSELQAENDGETSQSSAAVSAVKPTRELTPSQIANQKRLDEYERSKRASKEAAARAELDGVDDDESESENGGRAAMNPQQLNSHMKRMEDLSSKLGAKMLQGWTLLGDACPNEECNCPLMRAKGAKEMFCVNCESTIEKQGDTLVIVKKGNKVPVGAAKSAPAASAPSSSLKSSFASSSSSSRQTRRQRFEEEDEDQQEDDQQDEDERLMEEDRNSYRFRARAPVGASSSVKESEEEGEMADVIDPFRFNDLPDDLSDSVLNAPPVRNAPRSRAPSRVDQFSAPSPGLLSRATSSDDVSAKLGEKMLQGYALLSQHCPRDGCNCPLVRKKDGPMMCVKCGSTVVDESEYDESIHGPADNLPSSDSKSPSSNSPSRAAIGKGSITPVKRLASPSLNEMRDDSAESKKPRANSLSGDGSNSTGSSGLPSPNATASRSRTWSIEDGESTIDPRLRSQAQLGGKSGRFSAPSRAPSFAVGPNPALLGTRHTSSAALNAAAQMAFSNGRMLSPHYTATNNGKGSAPNSVEQSPSHASANTPPHTPAIPSLALPQQNTNNTPASVGKGFHYPHSRYPSVNLGSSVSVSGLQGARGSLLQATSPATAGVKFSLPASVSLPTPEFNNGAAPLNARSTVTSPSSVSFAGINSASLSAPSLSSSSSSVYNGALDASERILLSKLAECSQQLSECVDTILMRELAQTMRELVSTIQHLRKAYEA